MHSLIISYLFQSNECTLPGIGVLEIIHTPASTDAATNRILPPFEEIIFKKDDHSKPTGLVKYIAAKKNIDEADAENLLNDFSKEWQEKINVEEELNFETVGTIQKNTDGVIFFEKENAVNFLQPISVDEAYPKKELPEPIVEQQVPEVFETGDEDVIVERSYWGLWALILFAIGAVVIFYHFKENGISHSTIGNQNQYPVDSTGATYTIPDK
ncbi:MAG: hypothetical protein ABIW34_06800 [Ginsengibacter sp.]